jgi:heterodisulfide reductase subunit B
MKLAYYPGCTLKNHARNFEDSALCSLEALGVEAKELERWNCCGTVFSLATDDLIHHLAPVRNLIRVKESGAEGMLTLCAMCYNTIKRSNERVRGNPDDLDVINDFMYKENVSYEGDVKVLHLLELLRDDLTFGKVAEKVTKTLAGLKVGSYYGCYLIRPGDIGFDDPENPTVLENLTASLGATAVDFPLKTECCASYQTVENPELVADRTYQIVGSALDRGAEVLTVSCPLCAFNLDQRQKETVRKYPDFKGIPVLYFTQLLAVALGCPPESLRLDLHYVDPAPILKKKGLI